MKIRHLAPIALLAACGSQQELDSAAADLSFKQKPQIVISEPAEGALVRATGDGMVKIAGSARGSSVRINGQSVPIDASGRFTARFAARPGMNVIEAKINSLWGGEAQRAFLYGDFAAPGAPLKSGVLVRAGGRTYDDRAPDLDDFSSVARAMLAQTDIAAYLRSYPPFSYDFGIGSVDIYVTGVRMAKEKTALSLTPKAAGAHLAGSFAEMAIDLHLVVHFLGDHASDATVSVDTVAFAGDMNAKLAGAAIEGSMARPDIALGKLSIDVDIDFPGADAFVTWLANKFRGVIASGVATAIQQHAANHFAAALNQLGLPSTFDLSGYGLPAVLAVADAFDDQTAFDDAGATFSASTGFTWSRLPPGAPGAGAAGSLLVGSARQASFPDAALGVSVSFDALNQAFFAVWGQNGFVRTVLPAKSYALFDLDAVVAAPSLQPVLTPSADGRVQLSLGDLQVHTRLHNRFFSGEVLVNVSAVAEVTLAIDAQTGALRMTLSGKPQIWIDVNDLLGIVPDALLLPLSEILTAMAPGIVANLVKPMAVPLPRLPLSKLIQGEKGSIALAAPASIAVDAARKRVTVSGDLAYRAP